MIAHKKAAGDQVFIMTELNRHEAKDINKVLVRRTDKGADPVESEFTQLGERWYLNDKGQKVKVLGFRIEDMIKNIKAAKHDDTAMDAGGAKDAAHYGLAKPKIVVTLSGKYKGDDKSWEFKVGDERA